MADGGNIIESQASKILDIVRATIIVQRIYIQCVKKMI